MFDKTKYGQNTIVSQMTKNDEKNIIFNKCHHAIWQRIPCYMSHMHENCEKNFYIEIWYENMLLTRKQHTRNGKITENKLLHMQKLPCRAAIKTYMCVVTDICRNMYVKCTTK